MFKTLEEGPLICSQSYNSIPSFPSRVSAKSLICWELLLGGDEEYEGLVDRNGNYSLIGSSPLSFLCVGLTCLLYPPQ